MKRRLLLISGFGLALIVGVFIASPPAAPPAEERNKQQCLLNLRIIEGAKEQWAVENHSTVGAKPTPNDLAKYINGGLLLSCPQGAVYEVRLIGQSPACPVHTNLLPASDISTQPAPLGTNSPELRKRLLDPIVKVGGNGPGTRVPG